MSEIQGHVRVNWLTRHYCLKLEHKGRFKNANEVMGEK